MLGRSSAAEDLVVSRALSEGLEDVKRRPQKWSMGVLNDIETEEVPGERTSGRTRIQAITDRRLFGGGQVRLQVLQP